MMCSDYKLQVLKKNSGSLLDEGVWFEDGRVHFDDNNSIPIASWGYVCRQQDPSSFVTKLCYALVGYDILERCMVGDPKTGRKKTVDKKHRCQDDDAVPEEFQLIIMRQLEIFLRRRGYHEELAARELSKLNIYLHRACTYSRRKLKIMEERSRNDKDGMSSSADE